MRRNKHLLIAATAAAGISCLAVGRVASGQTLRIASYNIDDADQSSDNNITGSAHTLPTVVTAMGLHHIGANAQQVDVMSCEELNPTTLSNLVNQLNLTYGAGTYAFDPTSDPTTGGGTDGIIYNTKTVQVVSARALKTGQNVLLQSNGTYTAAHSPGGGTNGVTRAPMLYQVRPIGYGSNADVYMYVSHARSTSDDSVGDARYAEAQAVRSDAKYNLPANAHIMYAGDWNLFNGSNENAYKCLTGQTTSDGISWADTSTTTWANTNPTQAFDPTSLTGTTTTWTNAASDNQPYLYGDSTSSLTSRIDIQLMNAPMLGAGVQPGLQLARDTSDPSDALNFPASKYPYAFEVFGNDGSAGRSSNVTSASNHSLDDLNSTTLSAATIKSDLLLTGSGASFAGSDHLPLVGDYSLVGVTPATRFYVGSAAGTWNTTANWSGTDHGTGGASVPINGTPVMIDSSSNTTVTFDASYTGPGVSEIHVNGTNGATATLKQSANTLSVAGSIFLGETAGTSGVYSLSGGTLSVGASIDVGGTDTAAGGNGQVTITGGSVAAQTIRIWTGGAVTVSGGTLSPVAVNIAGGTINFASSQRVGAVSMTSGTATLSGAGTILTVSALTMASPAKLDVTSDKLVVNYTGTSPAASIRQLLVSGFNAGNWDGAGIDSSTAHSDATMKTAVGYFDTGSSVVVKYTYYGDNNLDGKVDTADFQMFLDGFVAPSGSSGSWSQGDYTYDGTVDLGNDFNLFLINYLGQGNSLGDLAPFVLNDAQLSAVQKSQFLAMVPEPCCALMIPLAASGALGRRSKKGHRRNSETLD